MSRTRVLRFALSLRYVMLIASFTAALGALVLFWEAGGKMVAATVAALSGSESKPVIALVMGGTDVLLFGIVLVIFAYTIALGFVYNLKPEERDSLPSWMRSTGMDEMKARLVGVILVYLVVDFATDWAENPGDQTWIVLAKPVSILLIAAAFRLFASKEADTGAADQDRPA